MRDIFSRRLDSPLENVSDSLKKRLNFSGKSLCAIRVHDILPVLIGIQSREHRPHGSDVEEFLELATAGQLNNVIGEHVSRDPNTVRKLFSRYIWGSDVNGDDYQFVRRSIEDRFPSIAAFHAFSQRNGLHDFKTAIGKAERELIVDRAASETIASQPPDCFTGVVSDGLVATIESAKLAERALTEAFSAKGVKPTITVENWAD